VDVEIVLGEEETPGCCQKKGELRVDGMDSTHERSFVYFRWTRDPEEAERERSATLTPAAWWGLSSSLPRVRQQVEEQSLAANEEENWNRDALRMEVKRVN
jgi:hypothetical protein